MIGDDNCDWNWKTPIEPPASCDLCHVNTLNTLNCKTIMYGFSLKNQLPSEAPFTMCQSGLCCVWCESWSLSRGVHFPPLSMFIWKQIRIHSRSGSSNALNSEPSAACECCRLLSLYFPGSVRAVSSSWELSKNMLACDLAHRDEALFIH